MSNDSHSGDISRCPYYAAMAAGGGQPVVQAAPVAAAGCPVAHTSEASAASECPADQPGYVAPGSAFDSEVARTNSLYVSLAHPDQHDKQKDLRRQTPYIVPEDKLWPDDDDARPSSLVKHVHDQFRTMAWGPAFPCVGAHSVMNNTAYRFGLYEEMGSEASALGMGRDLARFIREQHNFGDYTAFIASFKLPRQTSEESFEEVLWRHLQLLHNLDDAPWDPHHSSDPQHPEFSFSFKKRAFFIVGFHGEASRYSRRFSYPTLMFNAEYQVAKLRDSGLLGRWYQLIRANDIRLQGNTNPSIPTSSDNNHRESEARVYSGMEHRPGDPWQCPFRARLDIIDPKKVG